MVCFVFNGPKKAVARSCPFDHTWNLGLGTLGTAHVSEPYLSHVHKARISPFLDNVHLNALISDTERYNFSIAESYWLNPSILKAQSITWFSDRQFVQDPYWAICFRRQDSSYGQCLPAPKEKHGFWAHTLNLHREALWPFCMQVKYLPMSPGSAIAPVPYTPFRLWIETFLD